ncbi:MAG: type II toxin-antitoxin system PemK/MazF family toxin [Desulfobacterium sp.]|nr:type II toxin-antitoxin system PemK/MazF family toxin [Desulfobacterium sp.]MBU3950042.1 type II toxin-antitoxin system PemK/MazF family toxin [Pseudomonadota bacterium]MBU4036559.1 type II toxin-antitoxin system PemK/MazF family toxin [Pseudomonadota bacterium]
MCRFDIGLVQLDPAKGSEIKKTRPCVVISSDEMSSFKTAIVAPMAPKGYIFPARINVPFRERKD